MLFRKKHSRSCGYCIHGTQLADGQILCVKHGVRSEDSACRKFTYDPCKRIPPKPKAPDFVKFSEEDFTL